MAKVQGIGFGFVPEETTHQFLIRNPRSANQNVAVYERFTWDEEEIQKNELGLKNLKVSITKKKWDMVKDVLQQEFNQVLKSQNIIVGKFKIGDTPVERLFGKEVVLLLWAIEDADPQLIPTAIKNWLGFSREERWWLFTMTNAVTGQADNKKGWRKAVRYALTENPIDDSKGQTNMFEMFS